MKLSFLSTLNQWLLITGLALIPHPCLFANEPPPVMPVKIYPGVAVTRDEVYASLKQAGMTGPVQGTELIVYFFSTGVEKLSIANDGKERSKFTEGSMKALIKFRKDGTLVRVLFIEAGGESRKEILEQFGMRIKEALTQESPVRP